MAYVSNVQVVRVFKQLENINHGLIKEKIYDLIEVFIDLKDSDNSRDNP